MTARGKQVKLQTLQTDQEIFLYDRRLLAATSTKSNISHVRKASFTPLTPEAPPRSSHKDATLQAWQHLFKERQKWATNVADSSRRTVEQISQLEQERNVIQRGTAIAVSNIKQHIGSLKPKYEDTRIWADQICEDQRFLLKHWRDRLEKLEAIRISRKLGQCLRGSQAKEYSERTPHAEIGLRGFVNPKEVEEAAGACQEIYREFAARVTQLKHAYGGIVTESDRIAEDFQSLTSLSNSEIADRANGLMEEIEVLAAKLTADNKTVQGLPDTTKSIAQASKTAQLHDSTFVNSLIQTNEEVRVLLQQIVDLNGDITKSSLQYLQQIATVESNIHSIHTLLAALDVDPKSARMFETLNFAVRLPATYGSLLVEYLRRYEYLGKWTGNHSSVAEETTILKAEEHKRRQRWAKEMSGAVDVQFFDEMTSGFGDKSSDIGRQDIDNYISQLEWVGGWDDAVKEVKVFYNSLSVPSRLQTKRESAFKNGSIHEAEYGRNSVTPRIGDETMTSIRKDKTRAEERLKSAESRIRKLEDLLHRQSQYPRPLSAKGLGVGSSPTFERQASSPIPNFTSALSKAREPDPRRAITSSRRVSFNQESEDKGLVQRVVSLEAELTAQREQSRDLEKQSSGRMNTEEMLKEQARDAIRTKEDLLSNFETQKHEYDHDRQMFADESKKLKIRIEELEDEIDRVCQSQEYEFKIQALTEDIDNIKKDAAKDAQRAHQEIEEVRQVYLTQRDTTNRLERELQRLAVEKSQFQSQADEQLTQIRSRDQALADHHRALRSTLLHVSKESAPEEFSALVETVETVVEKSAAHQKALESTLQGVRGDNNALNTRLSSQSDEIYDLRERLGTEERQTISLREEIEQKAAQNADLMSQLDTTRKEQQELESRVAAGSTDVEDLQVRVGKEETTNGELSAKIRELEDEIQDLQTKVEEKRSELASLEGSYVRLNANRDAQAARADEISRRLFVQNATIQHLLEQVGFSVMKQDNNTIIQKISTRTASGSATLNDPSASMKRSISGPLPTKSDLESMVDPNVLHWAQSKDPEQASRSYDEFIKDAANFDMDAFYEAMYRRIKEVEHIARKGQRDARSYRDKAHRAQSEAHDRLALRSFKEGDLALFLPTRDQATKPWAAFNVGAPHYFLREQDSHKLGKRDWLIARISKIEERVVDLSKSMNGLKLKDRRASVDGSDGGAIIDDENPYELSDGLRWYLIDAAEEKPGAPINIGLGKTTVASMNVDAKGSIRMKKASDGNGATRTLTRSLDSRRSSANSKKGLVAIASNPTALEGMADGPKSPTIAAVEITDAEDHSRPEGSRTLDIPGSKENRTEQVGTPTSHTPDR